MKSAKVPRYLVNFDTGELEKSYYDLLVIGSGIAGLTAALRACGVYKTLLATKTEVKETTTWYAQGGVASAISEEDSPRLHFEDTIKAGDGLCNTRAVEVLVTEGLECIADLMTMGAKFDRLGKELKLAREGGHSVARVLHAGDSTGSQIESTLVRAAKFCAGLEIKEHAFIVDLLTQNGRCVGALFFDPKTSKMSVCFARAVILATGGAGHLFSITTNPVISTGDGLAMAYRAGAVVADMEFIQFHPTALDEQKNPRFLITEALRGEGAYLKDCRGERFMVGVHSLAELAPRDVVVREMVKVMRACGEDHVYLDASHIPAKVLKERYSTIWQRCLESGFDLSKDLIPVSPAAHYMIGGVRTDLNGRSSLPGLYASGEVAATGVHGANRLASNSLLEGLVFSRRIMQVLGNEIDQISQDDLNRSQVVFDELNGRCAVDLNMEWEKLQRLMTADVGVVRSAKSLSEAKSEVEKLERSILNCQCLSIKCFELRNLTLVAGLVIKAALQREESRGTHFREDFLKKSARWLKHITLSRSQK